MLLLRIVAVALTLAVIAASSHASPQPTECYVFVEDGMAAKEAAPVLKGFADLVGTSLAPGSMLHVHAADGTVVASMTIPDGNRNRRLRDRSVQQPLKRVVEWVKSPARAESAGPAQLVEMPAVVRATRRGVGPVWVIVVTDPVYDDPANADWSMKSRRVPTHAAASRQPSPLAVGVAFPPETVISWLTPSSGWGVDAAHRSAIEEFWRVWAVSRAATLGRFGGDHAAAFTPGLPLDLPPVVVMEDEVGMRDASFRPDGGGEYRRREWRLNSQTSEESIQPAESEASAAEVETPAEPVPTPRKLEPTPVPTPEPADELEPTPAPPQSLLNPPSRPSGPLLVHRPPLDEDQTIEVALAWRSTDPETDLDLRVRSSVTTEELTHRDPETTFGRHLGDVRTPGDCDHCKPKTSEWERVVLRKRDLPHLELWVNVYHATSAPEVFVEVLDGEKRSARSAMLSVDRGDRGRGSDRRGDSGAWRRLRLPSGLVIAQSLAAAVVSRERSILRSPTREAGYADRTTR
ncbi:MAG: hypothetical protein ACRCT8_00665 [Lacipirellulaceae bacterium]